MNAPIYPAPGKRIDALVTDPFTGASRWRTDYAGVIWYGHPPPTRNTAAVLSRMASLDGGFFVPDGHAYQRDGVEDAELQLTAGLFRTSGDSNYLIDAVASFADDPRGGGAAFVWIAVRGSGRIPVAVSYHLVVQTAMTAVVPNRSGAG